MCHGTCRVRSTRSPAITVICFGVNGCPIQLAPFSKGEVVLCEGFGLLVAQAASRLTRWRLWRQNRLDMTHPYASLPARAFWRSCVAGRSAREIEDVWRPKFEIRPATPIVNQPPN
jgi:hypothetical protein